MENQHRLPTTGAPTRRGTKLLLVEDNPEQAALMGTVLRTCMPNVDLLLASTGEQALSHLQECLRTPGVPPRLILLDLYLPTREEGWQVLSALKAPTSPYRLLPLTLLSHSGQADDIQTAYQLGANSYITKPVSYPQWLAYFESLRDYWLHTVTFPA